MSTTSSANPFTPEELIFSSPEDAARVLTELLKEARRYSMTTVERFHQMAGVLGHYTDWKFGWKYKTLQMVTVKSVEDGYVLTLPNPEPITD